MLLLRCHVMKSCPEGCGGKAINRHQPAKGQVCIGTLHTIHYLPELLLTIVSEDQCYIAEEAAVGHKLCSPIRHHTIPHAPEPGPSGYWRQLQCSRCNRQHTSHKIQPLWRSKLRAVQQLLHQNQIGLADRRCRHAEAMDAYIIPPSACTGAQAT